MAAHHIKTSHSPFKRSIPEAPTRGSTPHPTPAIPHLAARFHKRPLETQISEWHDSTSKPFKTSHSPSDVRFDKRPLETHIGGMTAHQNQAFPIQTLDSTWNHPIVGK